MTDDIVTRLRTVDIYSDAVRIMDQAADEIDRLRADNKKLLFAYEHLRELVDQFAEHCRCEHSSATMFILHRAAMKHDPWSVYQAGGKSEADQ